MPAGLSKSEYEKIRAREAAKKEQKYAEKSKNAFKFIDFTKFYLDRGTDENGSWLKAPALGHRMAKTKYDFSGNKDRADPRASKGKLF